MRKSSIAAGVVGVVFLVAAALLAFWITPAYIARLPASTHTVRSYAGKVQSIADPAALARGDFAHALKVNLPMTIRREVKVLDTSGSTALVRDSNAVDAAGRPIGGYTAQYAVDRSSLEATANHPGSWSVTSATGLTINWPIGAEQHNYTGWDEITHTTSRLTYVRQQEHAGITTYVYQTTVRTAPIKNAQILQRLPSALPVRVLEVASKAGFMPASLIATVQRAFPHAATVPLGYLYTGTSTYWVAPTTGEVVDVNTSEKQIGGIALPGGKIVPVLPVLVDSYRGDPPSVTTAVTDAKNNANGINLLGVTLPIILAIVGFILIVLAIILWMVGRRRARPARGRTGPGPVAPPA